MKLRTVLIVVLSLNCMLAFSQKSQKNLSKYYSNVWAAERCMLSDDYKTAAALYKKAFKYKKWAFEADYYNAKYCFRQAGRSDSAYLKKSILAKQPNGSILSCKLRKMTRGIAGMTLFTTNLYRRIALLF